MLPNPTFIDLFFEAFGKEDSLQSLSLSADYPTSEQARRLAAHYDNITEPGHGFFFEFKNCEELEELVIEPLTNQYGFSLEKGFFLRKPE